MQTKAVPFDKQRASFITHLNYIRCLKKILSEASISVSTRGSFIKNDEEVNRFRNLFRLTKMSLATDIRLARHNPAFAIIVAPWFPVKCYYALYYLESILIHLADGSNQGFTRGGHTSVRKVIYTHITTNLINFTITDLSSVYSLASIDALPPIPSGSNTSSGFWEQPQCISSLLKKLKEYKVHNQMLSQKWNLHRKKDREEKNRFIAREKISLLDFFYWYRIKANYRDLDYIDFENGISEAEVLCYLEEFNNAFELYKDLLEHEVDRMLKLE